MHQYIHVKYVYVGVIFFIDCVSLYTHYIIFLTDGDILMRHDYKCTAVWNATLKI